MDIRRTTVYYTFTAVRYYIYILSIYNILYFPFKYLYLFILFYLVDKTDCMTETINTITYSIILYRSYTGTAILKKNTDIYTKTRTK